MKHFVKHNLKLLGSVLKGLILFLYTIFLFVIIIIFLFFYESHIPPQDFSYVEILENYANDSLPSCIVRKKMYDDGYELSVTYLLDENDFQKVLIGIQSNSRAKIDSNNYIYRNEAFSKDFPKINQLSSPQFDYCFRIYGVQSTDIGFKEPRLIFLYRNYLN